MASHTFGVRLRVVFQVFVKLANLYQFKILSSIVYLSILVHPVHMLPLRHSLASLAWQVYPHSLQSILPGAPQRRCLLLVLKWLMQIMVFFNTWLDDKRILHRMLSVLYPENYFRIHFVTLEQIKNVRNVTVAGA